LFGYFQLRGLRWEGDKAAVRHLMAHDPAYMDLLTRFLGAQDREHKCALYQQLAVRTVAPVGSLWKEGETAITFEREPVTLQMVDAALGLWENLLEQE
jgi:hypothetical protein